MRGRIKTVKNQIILLMVTLSVIVVAAVTAFGLYLINVYQRQITLQSAEHNLLLVADLIERDLRDLTTLGRNCGISRAVTHYFLSDVNEKMSSVQAYNYMAQEARSNRVGLYVRRLLAVNGHLTKILHVDNYANSSRPVNRYNIDRLSGISGNVVSEWETVTTDPFYSNSDAKVIPLICPVYHSDNWDRIGTVYLAASTSVITDKLKGYKLPENSVLYLDLGGGVYCIEGNSIIPAPFEYEPVKYDTAPNAGPNTTVLDARDPNGRRYTLVTCPVRSGISITQALAPVQYYRQGMLWIWMLLGLVFIILAASLIVTYRLDHIISRPIAMLCQRLDAIAKGDFSPDPELNFDNELDLVGHGVNRMSQDIAMLMETRIKDEQQKRDLEYRMLQSQITPHFLHNTLNTIKWMATLQSADGIAEIVTSLSRLMKTVSKDIRKIVTLNDELDLLNDYLVIQKYRYGNNVAVTIDVGEPSLLKTPMPRFSLQPLVENAIFHGIEPKGFGNIFLEAVSQGGDVLITITDDGVGISDELLRDILKSEDGEQPGMFSKFGLRNVDERLRYAFGDRFGLSIHSEEGRYTAMTLRLPAHAADRRTI